MINSNTFAPTLWATQTQTGDDDFRADVLNGLSREQKRLPCKYLYDERGSQLFEEICRLDEYYPTRTELAIMEQYGAGMADQIGAGVRLVEYGSGSSTKTRILLQNLDDPVAYVPVDISGDHLESAAAGLADEFPNLEVLPVCADFTKPFSLPAPVRKSTHTAVYFPGSTIGNFCPEEAQTLLARIASSCGAGGGLLIGIDLQKDIAVLEAAYNDSRGTTAEFNRNLLHRINRDLDGDFDPEAFQHVGAYNADAGRMELYLESSRNQQVSVDGSRFDFTAGERIHTENSHKYTIEGFQQMAAAAGLTLRRQWTDDHRLFAVLHLAVVNEEPI